MVYFGFLSWKYDIVTGGAVSALTWSFFVLCTPIADAGFLLDFPFRLITGLKMIFSELAVWLIAISLNVWAVNFHPDFYGKTGLTELFHKILTTPWPYWSIIILCALGTFLSVWFGDEVMSGVGHKKEKTLSKKHRIVAIGVTALIFILIVFVYYHLLSSLGISIESLKE